MRQLMLLLRKESGTTAIEYALILTILSIVAIASMIAMGGSVSDFYQRALDAFR